MGIGKCTVNDLIRMRLLRSVKVGRYRRIPVEACREMVARTLNEESAA